MPITQTCPTCGGSGVQTLGMSFGEAVDLAQRIGTAGNLFTVYSIESRTFGPSGAVAWVVVAGHLPSSGTRLSFKREEDFTGTDWRHWDPISQARTQVEE